MRPRGRVTHVWEVVSVRGTVLGRVDWWPGCWRRYTFTPRASTIFDPGCLREIADFCEDQTLKHKEARRRLKERNG